MIILSILIIVYLISIYFAYKFIRYSYYHEQGRWSNGNPDTSDIFVTFCPGMNTMLAINFLTGEWKRDEYKSMDFFKPKKPLK